MKKMKFILSIICIMTLSFSSCEDGPETMTISENEIIEEQNALLDRLGLSDFETIIIDGTVTNDPDHIEELLSSANNIHFNYQERELVISSTKEEAEKYFAKLPNFNDQLEIDRQNALNQTIDEVASTDWLTLKEKIESEIEANSTNRSSSDPHFHDFYLDDYSNWAFFVLDMDHAMAVSPIRSYLNMNSQSATIHYTSSYLNTPNSTFNQPIVSWFDFSLFGSNEVHLRNTRDKTLLIRFYGNPNYSGQSRSVLLLPNSDIRLTSFHLKPDGYIAESVYTRYYLN